MLIRFFYLLILAFLSSLLFFNNPVYATSYSLAVAGSDDPYVLYDNYQYHWDDWCVEWDASTQQSNSFMPSGNMHSMTPTPFRITSDSGTTGEKVAVSMTFEMDTKIAFGDTVLYNSPIGNEENFAGFDSFNAWVDYEFGVDDQIWSYSANTTDPWADINDVYTVTLQTELDTYTDYNINMGILDHCMVSASGTQAIDMDEDFAVVYGLSGFISLTDISIAPISIDEANPILWLVLGFLGLTGLRNRKCGPLKGVL